MTTSPFAAAQAQIAARAARNDNYFASPTSSDTKRSPYIPSGIRSLVQPSINAISSLYSPFGTRPAFRVGQVDAELLDAELLSLLRGQVSDATKYFGTHIGDDWNAETTTALQLVLWKLSIWDRGATYGGSLQGLKYINARAAAGSASTNAGLSAHKSLDPTRSQKLGHGLVTIAGSYAWQKWEQWLLVKEDHERANRNTDQIDIRKLAWLQRAGLFTRYLSTTHQVAALASFLVFLYNGKFRTITDRLLGLRLASAQSHTGRQVSFEYLNRQLVWHAFTEFLLFLLPLVGVTRWKRLLRRFWKDGKNYLYSWSNSRAQREDDDLIHGELSHLPERTCGVCYNELQNPPRMTGAEGGIATDTGGGVVGSVQTDITNPYETTSCGCVYCFVCLAHQLDAAEGQGWTCLRCGEMVFECRPWNGDVVQENIIEEHDEESDAIKLKRMSRKSVGFVEDDLHDHDRHEKTTRRLSAIDPVPMDDEDNLDAKADMERDDESATDSVHSQDEEDDHDTHDEYENEEDMSDEAEADDDD